MDPELMANVREQLAYLAKSKGTEGTRIERMEVHNTLLVVLQVLEDQRKVIEVLQRKTHDIEDPDQVESDVSDVLKDAF